MSDSGTAESDSPTSRTRPRVTVVIPAYNAERTLTETLSSVAAQTMHDLEVIVVDDGSKDGTADVARAFPDLDVRVVTQANAGHAAARNTGTRPRRGADGVVDATTWRIPMKL